MASCSNQICLSDAKERVPPFDAVAVTKVKLFHQNCDVFYFRKCALIESKFKSSGLISLECVHSPSIIFMCPNLICLWKLRVGEARRKTKKVNERYATISVGCLEVRTQGHYIIYGVDVVYRLRLRFVTWSRPFPIQYVLVVRLRRSFVA